VQTKTSILLWKDIYEIADKVCKNYGLTYSKILPETRKLAKSYGECRACKKCVKAEHIENKNCNEKILFIRIHQLNNTKKPLATSTILRTLVHELAHLGVWEHGKAHRKFEKEITNFIRNLGYRI